MSFRDLAINALERRQYWSLFLDRDGVINRRLVDDYVKQWDDFDFLEGVLEAIAIFAKEFKHIFIVTNQQGIGRGLMSEEDLKKIHHNMLAQINAHGGRIDAIYHCPDLARSGSRNRKPQIGMALQAQSEFPTVDFSRSIMLGDSKGDIQFAENAGMIPIFINTESYPKIPEAAQLVYPNLREVAHDILLDKD
jgi:histidinol-phosphate phosphatase family protein